jgi:hypothetical protein
VGDALVNEVDDVLRRGAGEENFSDTGSFQLGNIGFGNDAADQDSYILHAFVVEQGHELGAERVVRAGENGEANDVNVLLNGGGGDHLRSLAEASVDDFHAGVAEGAGDYFSAAIVAIEAGLGDQDSDFLFWHSLRLQCLLPSDVRFEEVSIEEANFSSLRVSEVLSVSALSCS